MSALVRLLALGAVLVTGVVADESRLPAAGAGEVWESLVPEAGVRVLISRPTAFDASRPVRLVLYALPAGNTIEQTAGKMLAPGDDWHFDIQHIAAQTRWLRQEGGEPNLVVAYLECVERSWVLWRRTQPDAGARIVRLVDGLAEKFPGAKITLAGHSAGGSLIFGYLDAVPAVPERVERIAFLDSNYAYDAARGHDAKLADWLAGGVGRVLSVLAYEDYRALLDGKSFVSAEGGTWGRSQALLADLGRRFTCTRIDESGGLRRITALDGRIEFLLLENPDRKVWHTRLVELNGFCQAMLAGTPAAGRGYRYLGERAYGAHVLPARN